MRFVPGTEISVRPPSGSMHLLAYLPSADAEPLATRIRAIADYRASRNQRIVERLNELGYAIAWEDVAGARRAGSAGRTSRRRSSTRAMSATMQDAFDRLLADGQPAYVDAGSLGPEEAVELVAASGGAPVLAHPYTLRLGDAELERFVARPAGTGCAASSATGPITTTLSARSRCGCARSRSRADRRLRLARRRRRPGARRSGPVPLPADTLARLGLA